MNGREEKKWNDLFFVCSLIEYIARKTRNERRDIVNAMGRDGLEHYYSLADVYHCDNIDRVTADIIAKYGIRQGSYDNLSNIDGRLPTHWDIGKVMHRIIKKVTGDENGDIIEALIKVYNSWIVRKIDNYNSSMYYENDSYLYASYVAGHAL